MSFEVIVRDLRRGAAALEQAAEPFACYHLPAPAADPAWLGHVELAAWLEQVLVQADTGGRALHDGADTLAERLRGAATAYEQADQQVHSQFTSPPGWAPAGPGQR